MSLRALLASLFLLGCAMVPREASAAILCGLVGTSPALSFGTVAGSPTPQVDVATSVTVRCLTDEGPLSAKVCLRLSPGSPDTSLLPTRRMANGVARLNFQVTRDAARLQVFGEGGPAAPMEGRVPVTTPTIFGWHFGDLTFNFYGRVQAGQLSIPRGAYASTMTLSLTGGVTSNASCNALNNVQDSEPVQATATVAASCTIAANPLNFGTVNVLTANINAATSLGLTCTSGAPWTIRMNGGTVTGNVAGRRMGVGGTGPGVINYELRHTSQTGPLWGDGTAGTAALTGTGTGTSQTIGVFGRVPGGQPSPPVGTYSDTVTVSVEF